MSVIIKGIDMPSKCRFCPCCADNGLIGMQREYFCSAVDSALEIDDLDKKPSACPLVEIPTPHGRLIDENELLRHKYGFSQTARVIIKNTDAVIEAEMGE